MNNWVGGPAWSASGNQWKTYTKESDLTDPGPSMTFVLLDEREDSINDGYFVVDMAGFPEMVAATKLWIILPVITMGHPRSHLPMAMLTSIAGQTLILCRSFPRLTFH